MKPLWIFALALASCGGPKDRETTTDGNNGNGDTVSGDGCPDEAKLVYVVDQNNKLLQFDPPTKMFADLGTLNCPASFGATPFSMGVDRTATAWVLYSNGELFRVDTKNNLACTKSAWQPNTGGNTVFGMGFSTDTAGGSTDTLFIAGGPGPSAPSSTLAKLDLTSFAPMTVGTVTGWPELTGTGNAELWGFFPLSSNTHVSKLDKTNGAAVKSFPLPMLNGTATAWAFAFHGGDFWVFLMKDPEMYTTVYQVNGTTGAITGMTAAVGRTIVGAGVSTCAPVIL